MQNLLPNLIEAIALIISAALGVGIKFLLENWQELPIGRSRKKVLKGIWKGRVQQFSSMDESEVIRTLTVELNLKTSFKRIIGVGKLYFEDQVIKIKLKGFFKYENYLQLDYSNHDQSVIQFGTLIFKLSSGNTELSGNFLGYGFITEQIIRGTGKFLKEKIS